MTRPARSAAARAPLWRGASSSFARDALSLLRQSMLFAASVGCLLGIAAVLLKQF